MLQKALALFHYSSPKSLIWAILITVNQNARLLHLALFSGLVLSGLNVLAQDGDGFWKKGGSGSWASSSSWDLVNGVIADGTDNTAYFGTSLEPAISANATFTLDGARSIGNIVFTGTSGPDNWTLSTGSGGPLTLDNDIDYPGITVFLANQQVTVSLVLAGIAGMEKLDAGTLIFTATNTYTGGTIISGGTLLVNGILTEPDTLTNLSGTLGGTGLITGPVVVSAGAMLAPGNASIGTLTISNSLTLLPGSKTLMDLKASTSTSATIQGLSTISYGGTLIVSNLAGTPVLGQNFPLFNGANTVAGNFNSLTPQLAGGGLRWRFNPATGILSVVSTGSPPQLASVTRINMNVVLQFTNGAPAVTNYILVSTNLALPISGWTRLATNIFDPSGRLFFTNIINPANLRQFYSIYVPATL